MYQALGPAIGKLSETTESRHGCKVNWETCLIKKDMTFPEALISDAVVRLIRAFGL
jgi:hypothetical protein